MDNILFRWVKLKKKNHRQYLHDQWKQFYPFLLSVDGEIGKEAQVVLATLSRLMATKIDKPIPHVKGWFNVMISITAMRFYFQNLHGV